MVSFGRRTRPSVVVPVSMHGALSFAPQERQHYRVQHDIIWDIRTSPNHARHASDYHHLSTTIRRALATRPALPVLHITCGVFPLHDWDIEVVNPTGVTVDDVLAQLYHTMRKRITNKEWARLSRQQQSYIAETFSLRTKSSSDPRYEHSQGVRRVDWLMSNTLFVGLTPSTDKPYTWTLTLKRNH